jgi:hypothetical protein
MTRVVTAVAVIAVLVGFSSTGARSPDQPPPTPRIHHENREYPPSHWEGAGIARSPAAVDTFVLGDYDFGGVTGPDTQGWTALEWYDRAVADTFFHVADATELNGGDLGRLIVLEGSQSLWCGASPSSSGNLCYYATLPGYGNHWRQSFISKKFPRTGDVELSFLAIWDSEPAEDITRLYYLNKSGQWWDLEEYHWYYPEEFIELESFVIPDSLLGDSVQVRFTFYSDGGWSDEDGIWPTDGAIVIDSLRLSDDTGVISFQDFEAESPGALATADGHWHAGTQVSIGDFSGLFPGVSVLQEDGCVANDWLWGFFNGSTDDYSCGGHPEQAAVPYGSGSYELTDYLSNAIWSPWIDWRVDKNGSPVPATAAAPTMEFDVYRDLPINNLMFYRWYMRNKIGGCAQRWRTDNYVYYGPGKDWYRHRAQLAMYIDPAAGEIQLALMAVDMCLWWCGYYGDGACHSHAPLFDNVRVYRLGVPAHGYRLSQTQRRTARFGGGSCNRRRRNRPPRPRRQRQRPRRLLPRQGRIPRQVGRRRHR